MTLNIKPIHRLAQLRPEEAIVKWVLSASLLVLASISGCASAPNPKNPIEDRISRADKQAALEYRALQQQDAQEAYKQGVQDTLMDFRGKMAAQSGFVWKPPIIEYVRVPAAVKNGAFIPSHVEAVIIKSGEWVAVNGAPVLEKREQK